jgi:hypothetical protein
VPEVLEVVALQLARDRVRQLIAVVVRHPQRSCVTTPPTPTKPSQTLMTTGSACGGRESAREQGEGGDIELATIRCHEPRNVSVHTGFSPDLLLGQ